MHQVPWNVLHTKPYLEKMIEDVIFPTDSVEY